MGWGWGWTGDCGCCEPPVPPPICVIFEDTFDRPDSTDIGSDWDEVSGDWSITSNALTTPVATSNGLAIALHDRDAGAPYVVDATVGRNARVVFDYLDNDNYHYVQFGAVGISSVIQLILYRVSGGVHSSVQSLASTTANTLAIRVCVTGSVARVQSGINERYVPIEPHEGLKAGAGSNSSFSPATTIVNSFGYYHHDSYSPGCETCGGNCESECCNGDAPFELAVDLGDLSISNGSSSTPKEICNDCDEIGGEYSAVPAGECIWRYRDPNGLGVCSNTFNGCAYPNSTNPSSFTGLAISVRLFTDTPCYLRATITVGTSYGTPDCPGGTCCERDEITYEGNLPNGDCMEWESLPLDLVSSPSPGACGNEWPSEITITAIS